MSGLRLKGSSMRGRIAVMVCAALGLMVVGSATAPAAARADFGFEMFDGGVLDAQGAAETQAGAHPYEAFAEIQFNRTPGTFGMIPDESPKDTFVELPPGLVGNLTSVPTCTQDEFDGELSVVSGAEERNGCPDASQIGVARVDIGGVFSKSGFFPIYNVVPPPGVLGLFEFEVGGVAIRLEPSVRTTSDYGVDLRTREINQALPVYGTKITLWGEPFNKSHNAERGFCLTHGGVDSFGGPCASDGPRGPFLTTPTTCGPAGVGLETRIEADSWAGSVARTHFFSHQSPPNESEQVGVTGCDQLPFKPRMQVQPTSKKADSASGLDLELSFPTQGIENSTGIATAALKDVRITLPDGMTINPASAGGLAACTDAQLGLGTDDPVACPEAAKIGEVEATTPLLGEGLSGGVYLRSQASGDPESGEMFRLALVLENPERGLLVKLPGSVRANAVTGQIVAEFDDNPQLPIGAVNVRLKTGRRAPLAEPQQCGPKVITAQLTSWGGQVANLSDTFDVPCPAGGSFAPKLQAGTVSPLAGGTSSFVLGVTRQDGEGSLSGITANLPAGLSAYLAGVPYCPDAAINAAISRTGSEEIQSPSCPTASRIGSVDAAVGVGGSPFHVDGTAYMAGPYKGAPLSLVVVTPAVAGPFDLGTVVVRTALQVDPRTAQISAVSDPLPQIIKGVPLRLRSIEVVLDRPRFTVNPTSCEQKAITSTILSAGGASASPASPFQAASCERLAFKPKLKLQLKGATKRIGHPALKAILTAKPGEAGIGRAQVNLPHGEFLDQGNLNKTCTRPVLMAGQCPASTVYGKARAWTPLLDKPLEGNVYLVGGYGYKLPALVADLNGQIRITLVGKVDSGKNKGIRNTFEVVPDAPVSRFELSMKGGKKYGLLENSENLCKAPKAKRRAIARFTGQNGKVRQFKPVVQNECGKHRAHGKHAAGQKQGAERHGK